MESNPPVFLMLITIGLGVSQLILIVGFGFAYGTFIKLKYRNSESLKIFKQKEYAPQFVEDPRVMSRVVPRYFRFVLVRYQNNTEEVTSESFYTSLGDLTQVTYSDGNCTGYSTTPYSNWISVAFLVTGMVLMTLASYFDSSMAEQLVLLGLSLFLSAGIAYSIKVFAVDYNNYL